MLFAEIFADPLTAAVYVYGTIAAFAMCMAAASALLRRAPPQQIAGRGEYCCGTALRTRSGAPRSHF